MLLHCTFVSHFCLAYIKFIGETHGVAVSCVAWSMFNIRIKKYGKVKIMFNLLFHEELFL